MLCLVLDLTYPAKAARAEIVSAGDGAFFQCWDGAGEGGEADYGCQGGGEVNHFGCGRDDRYGLSDQLLLAGVVVFDL